MQLTEAIAVPDLAADIAHRLEIIRKHLGMTQQAFAAALRATPQQYSNWMRGVGGRPVKPADTTLMLLTRIVPGLTLDWVYFGKADHLPYALAIELARVEAAMDKGELGARPPRRSPSAEKGPKVD